MPTPVRGDRLRSRLDGVETAGVTHDPRPDRTPTMTPARRLASVLEPIAGQAQFSREAHQNYVRLGFDPSPASVGQTPLPDRASFFTGRGSVLGQVPGTLIAAAFAVFNPEVVVPLVEKGWTLTNAAEMWQARENGAVASLQRMLPDLDSSSSSSALSIADRLLRTSAQLPLHGRAFFSAQRSLPIPDAPHARLWRAADRLREFRGDSHIIAWSSEGLTPIEVGLLGDQYWGLARRAHTGGRGWTDEQLDDAEHNLGRRALMHDGRITDAGFDLRDRIEQRTDDLVAPVVADLGADLDRIVATLQPWSDAIVAAGGYLSPLVRFRF